MAKEIYLSKGLTALVDDEDWERVNQFKWCASIQGSSYKKYYAVRFERKEGKRVKHWMHRFILQLDNDLSRVPDHLDGDGLNNTRKNLEVVSYSENSSRARRIPRLKEEDICL